MLMSTNQSLHNHAKNAQVEPSPWDVSPSVFFQYLQGLVPCDAMAVGALDTKRPRPDELMAVHGWSDAAIMHWCINKSSQDPLNRIARRSGWAITTSTNAARSEVLGPYETTMVHMLPDCLTSRTWWWLMVARKKKPFSSLERQTAALLVRQWRARFGRPTERETGRMLIGHDGRLILVDPWTEARLLHEPTMITQLLEALVPIVAQRWNNCRYETMRDFVIALTGQPYWICFHNNPAVQTPEGKHWYLELRKLEPDDLPAVGPLPDERVAQSLAFIHENFRRAPSLSHVASAVRVSPFHFQRLFVRHVGISPKQYVQLKQMQVARWMLRCSRSSIGSIAVKTGFASHGHFTSTFHRVVGVSPSQYRESH